MNWYLNTFITFLLINSSVSSPQRSSPVQGRYHRPPNQERGCGSSGRCNEPDRDRTREDDYKSGSDIDKNRPPILGRDDWPNPSTGGRPGVGSDYKPKPVSDESDSSRYDEDDYNPKPVTGGGNNRKPIDEYNPKPVGGGGGDYNPKPVDEYNPKPVDEYNPKPVGGGGGYNPKPIDEYNPKPVDDYDSESVDDYDTKPVGGGGYNPKPGRDDYNPKPVGGGGNNNDRAGGGYINPRPDTTGGTRIDLGGYDEPKDDDYNGDRTDDDDDDDTNVDEEVGKPVPVIDDGNCICVPYYQCTDGHIVTDGAGIIDARKRPEPEEDLPLDGKFRPPSCGPFHVCCNTPESSTVKPYEHRCGVRNPSGINSRILSPSNKGEADFGEWPWQAAVLKSEGTVNIFMCGGVLIDKYHVLTVAHCVFHLYKYNEYPMKVRLGEWDTQTTGEFLAHEDYKVSRISLHPEFRNTSLWNDIAILRLQEPVLFAPHIDSVCLPKYDENFAGQNCVVTGWGKDSYKGGTFSNVMKEVALQVIDNYKCEEKLRKTRLGRFFQLHEGFVCAGGEQGLDSCKGDGGGPLVCYRKDKSYALAGIVSWGIDCGQPDVPGVYVKIQKYLDWISKVTGVRLQEYWPKQ